MNTIIVQEDTSAPPPPKRYILELDQETAQVLTDITYIVAGDPKQSRRRLVEALHLLLRDEGGLKPNSDPNNGYYPSDMERIGYKFR